MERPEREETAIMRRLDEFNPFWVIGRQVRNEGTN